MTNPKPENTLEDIRREIDAIDDAIVDLLIRRFAATRRVRATKSRDGSLASSPLRPAREAGMLRRLIKRGQGQLPPQLLVRLWRVILSASTQSQAPITLHVGHDVASSIDLRVELAEHFCGIQLHAHESIASAFGTLAKNRGDLAVMKTADSWANAFTAADQGSIHLISSLPALGGSAPELLIFGHAESQPSGNDETILLSRSTLSNQNLGAVKWQVQSGEWWVTGLAGFLSPAQLPLNALLRSSPDVQIAGRFPSPIEVHS